MVFVDEDHRIDDEEGMVWRREGESWSSRCERPRGREEGSVGPFLTPADWAEMIKRLLTIEFFRDPRMRVPICLTAISETSPSVNQPKK